MKEKEADGEEEVNKPIEANLAKIAKEEKEKKSMAIESMSHIFDHLFDLNSELILTLEQEEEFAD